MAPRALVGFRQGVLVTSSAEVASLLLLFVETILVVRLLSTDEFGAYVLLLLAVNFLVMAIDFGCKVSATQLISSGDRAQQQAIVSSALTFRVLVLAGTSALVLLLHGLQLAVGLPPELAQSVVYLPIMVAAASLDELLSGMLQGFQAYKEIAITRAARAALRLVLTAVMLLLFHAGIIALVYSWVISFGVSILYQYWALPVRSHWGCKWATVLQMLRFGLPLQLTRFLGFIATRLHMTLLGLFAGADGVAFFAVAARIPDAVQVLSDGYFRVYFPTMAALLAAGPRKAAELLFERSLRLLSFGSALATVTAAMFSREILTVLFSDKYSDSAPVFTLLMIGLHMTVLVNVLGYTLTAAGRPGWSLGIDVVRAVFIVAGALLLIPPLDVVGSACAIVLGSYASNPMAAWLVRRSQLSGAVGLATGMKQTMILLLCVGLGSWIHPSGLAWSLAYQLSLVALFLILSVLCSTVSRDDLSLVRGSIRLPAVAV